MNRRQKIIASVTGIFLVLLLLVGLTYAYFLTNITGNNKDKSISVSTANLALVYSDGNGIIAPEEEIIPGTTLDSKTFTVKNNGNDTTEYVVVIEDVKVTTVSGTTTTFESNDFVYTLTCTSDGEACNGVDTEATFPINNGILIGNSVEVGKTHTYALTVTYKDTGIDQSADMNKILEAKVNIADPNSFNPYAGEKGSLAYTIINNAVTATSAEKEAGYAEYRAMPLTTPAGRASIKYNKIGEESTAESIITIFSYQQNYYWTYGTGYTIDPITGKFSLSGVSTCKYNDGTCHETLVGKYIVGSSATNNSNVADEPQNTTNVTSIYKVTTAPASSATPSATITMKTKKINKTSYSVESTLTTTADEYGTSYYYRGSVKNNYLEFNKMCWRIVRIEGDGSIKITLAAQKLCGAITTEDIGSAFIGDGNYGYIINYGEYSTQYLADYENSDNSTSSMKYKLDEWFTTNLSKVSNKLKTTQVCIGDTTIKYDDNGNVLQGEDLGYWNYESYKRLKNDKIASLICNANGQRTINAQIFPLTVDEVVFAGGSISDSNYSYFLRENASSNYWWTISLSNFSNNIGGDNAFIISEDGYISKEGFMLLSFGLRPAISLISGIVITEGNGTIDNPYIIN